MKCNICGSDMYWVNSEDSEENEKEVKNIYHCSNCNSYKEITTIAVDSKQMDLNIIHNMDCLDGFKMLPDCSIDMVLTSPPYDDLRNYKGYSFDFENIAKELFRVVKIGGVVVWVVNDSTVKGSESGTSFRQALYFKEIGFNLHDTMIYAKKNPTPSKTNRYQPSFEYMFVLSKGKPKTFNPIMAQKKYIENRAAKQYNKTKDGTQIVREYQATSDQKIISNIWEYSVGLNNSTSDKIAFSHPAIFPEALANDHIKSWSNEGDIVLDPFIGSGTTAKMAALLKRHYIGFEISEEYCHIAELRLQEAFKPEEVANAK